MLLRFSKTSFSHRISGYPRHLVDSGSHKSARTTRKAPTAGCRDPREFLDRQNPAKLPQKRKSITVSGALSRKAPSPPCFSDSPNIRGGHSSKTRPLHAKKKPILHLPSIKKCRVEAPGRLPRKNGPIPYLFLPVSFPLPACDRKRKR